MQIGRGCAGAAIEGEGDRPVRRRLPGVQYVGDVEDVGLVLALGVPVGIRDGRYTRIAALFVIVQLL